MNPNHTLPPVMAQFHKDQIITIVFGVLLLVLPLHIIGQSIEVTDGKGSKRFINWELSDNNIYNLNTNNVGIGTNDPQNRLEITQGTLGNSGLRLTNLPNAPLLGTDNNGDVILNNPATGTIDPLAHLGFNSAGDLVKGTLPFWSLSGNSDANNTNFLGTTNDFPLSLRSNNTTILTLGRRQTLGLFDGSSTGLYPYNRADDPVALVNGSAGTSALEFEANGALFYKPILFTDIDGNFMMRGSSAGTDFFELGSSGSANNGQLIFTIGDDGNEPIIFRKFNYTTQTTTEMLRLQGTGLNDAVRTGINVNGSTPNSTLQVNGSSSFSIINTTANLTLTENHHSVILGGNHSIQLPSANTCTGRMYFIKNPQAIVTSVSPYIDLSGTVRNTVTNNSALVLQSDGTNWHQIIVDSKATMTDNGNGTFTFSNAEGTTDDVVITAQAPNENTVVSSALWLDTSALQITTTNYSQGKSFVVPGGSLGTQNAIKITGYRRRGSNNQGIRLRYGGQTFFTSGG